MGLALSRPVFEDCRYAVRALTRTPGFTLTAALTLALGIGAITVMVSVVNAVLLRPLPFHGPDRLVLVFSEKLGITNQEP